MLKNKIDELLAVSPEKIVLSKPLSKANKYKKIVIIKKSDMFAVEKFTEKQAFHEKIDRSELSGLCTEQLGCDFGQLNAWDGAFEYIMLVSKKGKVSFKKKICKNVSTDSAGHNREKNYILAEGQVIPPLTDMGIFTKDGKVVRTMYDKYRQINRFIEIVDDAVKNNDYKHLNIIDFGCGKSYLTFILYYYFTEVKNISVNITGLDLKEDVIKSCNETAQKYGYENLHFELGDINGYKCDFDVDMVITLHACDTATDYALYNAVNWGAEMIFSVPCCQHELNSQIKTESLSLLTRYGIIKERTAALMTDAIRGNLLEASGYKTQLLEFVDLLHTPKNILIRAVKKNISSKAREKAMSEVENLMKEFNLNPTLYNLLNNSETKGDA